MRFQVTPSLTAAFEWETAASKARVGRGDSCDLRFQGQAGATVSWEHAEIFLAADGTAYVTDLGSSNGTHVDGQRIEAPTSIRVGSIIQLGRLGPRLDVLELTPAAQRAAGAAAARPARSSETAPTVVGSAAQWPVRYVVSACAVVVTAMLGFFVWRMASSPSVPPLASNLPPAMMAETSAPEGSIPPPSTKTPPEPKAANPPAMTVSLPATGALPTGESASGLSTTGVPAALPLAKVEADPWSAVQSQALNSFRLIVVEDPKSQSTWPFAGATIVGEKALLTTASVAEGLAKVVAQQWRVAAVRPGEQNGISVTDLRVLARYEQEAAETQLYFDMAVLLTDKTVGSPIVLASIAELTELERGQPLLCLAVDHQGDALDRFEQLAPQAYPGKAFAFVSLPPQPGGPRLLNLRGTFSERACGSPIINRQGHLTALYCEPVPNPKTGEPDPHMHYAKIIDPKMIELAVRGLDSPNWVSPHPPSTSDSPPEPSK